MGPGVASAWTKNFAIFHQYPKGNPDNVDLRVGEEFLKKLRKDKRYVEDLWR